MPGPVEAVPVSSVALNYHAVAVVFVVGVGVVLGEEGAEEVGEEVGMEVAEEEEGLLERVAPGGAEELSDVVLGGEVEGVVVGLEVEVEGFHLSREPSEGRV